MFGPFLDSIIMSENPFYAAIALLNNIYHHRLLEDPIVATHQVYYLLHVIYNQKLDIVLIQTDQKSDKQQ